MDDETIAETKRQHYTRTLVTTLVPLLDPTWTLTSLGKSDLEGRAVLGIKVVGQGHNDLKLFFDKETGLLSKSEFKASGREEISECIYSDYQLDADGILRARKYVLKHGNTTSSFQISDLKILDALPEGVFREPRKK